MANALTLAQDVQPSLRHYAQQIVDTCYFNNNKFKTTLNKTKNKFKQFAPKAEEREGIVWPRGEFFVQVLMRFMESTSIEAWRATDHDSEAFKVHAQEKFFVPTLSDMASIEVDSSIVTAFKKGMGKDATNAGLLVAGQ